MEVFLSSIMEWFIVFVYVLLFIDLHLQLHAQKLQFLTVPVDKLHSLYKLAHQLVHWALFINKSRHFPPQIINVM